MAIPHIHSGQVVNLRAVGSDLPSRPSFALFKSPHLEVICLVLPQGKRMAPHAVAGPITVQCLDGAVELGFEGRKATLLAGDLVYLENAVEHDVLAVEDARVLVTIVLAA